MAFHGLIVEPEGNLYKAATFDMMWAGLLLGWTKAEEGMAIRTVHVAGLAMAWQSGSGRFLFEPSMASALAGAALIGWGVVMARAVTAFLRKGVWPDYLVVA